jgi:small subunit ribosomal protein S9
MPRVKTVKPEPKVEKVEKAEKEVKVVVKKKSESYYFAIGRRKTAVARVKLLVNGSGEFTVNGLPADKYFAGESMKNIYLLPFKVTDTLNRFTVEAKVKGSGKSGQLGAVVHAISRSLNKVDMEKYHPLLKKQGLLTRDDRAKERVKAGLMGARKGKQSPKR